MRLFGRLLYRSNAGALICALLSLQLLHAQTQEPSRQDPADVLRVFTDLVQTDVMVFDKEGQFVKGLKKEDFELKIDGKVKPISFFETITSGTFNEELQLAAARGDSRARSTGGTPAPLDRGRPIYFYIDDLHMELQNVLKTKKLIRNFIDTQMGQNDEVAIAAASGQVGFLSQLTDNKFVLRTAVDRLSYRPYSARNFESPRMTEYQAALISNNDRDVTGYFVDQIVAMNPGITRETAERMVQGRANMILNSAANVTSNTLAGLQSLVRSANKISGRKLVFFISDGFLLENRNTETRERLRRITSAAARSGVVIYSLDARGLVPNFSDGASEPQFDPMARLARTASGELTALQDGLNALAHDTGGKAFFNSNSMEPAVKRAIDETATYYLLAWKPDQASTGSGKFHRIEVRIAGRPDLSVQVRRGFFNVEPEQVVNPAVTKAKQAQPTANQTQAEFQKLITALYPEREIPVSLGASFVNTPDKGDLLFATTLVPTQFLTFKPVDGKNTARVSLIGVIYNEKGDVIDRFAKQVGLSAKTTQQSDENLVFTYPANIRPGLYQVRVAVRDDASGKAGSARAWTMVPKVTSGEFTLSSVLLGTRAQPSAGNASVDPVGFSATDLVVSNRFSPDDFLRFIIFVYNAAHGSNGSKPDLAIQIQVVRDDQPVVTVPLKKLSLDNVEDLKRIPYAAEVSLSGLRSGRYVLHISVLDRIAKTSATQETRFEVL